MKNNYILNEGYNSNVFDRADKSYIFSNNKKYHDLSFGSGTLILGHASKIFKNSLKKILSNKSSLFATPNIEAIKYSKLLKKFLPGYSKFIFCNTGSEAIIKSLRIANAITKKNLIISATGSWHGSVDKTLFTANKKLKPIPISSGLTNFNKKNIKFVPYNDIKKSKYILDKNKKKISCILVEPVQASLPQKKVKDYLKFLNNYCKSNNMILIFDEIVTGVRFNGSTAQHIFKLNPNISTFGKCFGGGFPIGIIALRDEIFKKILKLKMRVFYGGTFSGNQISTFIGRKTLEYTIKNKKEIFSQLEKKSAFFEKNVKEFIIKKNIKVNIFRYYSIIRIVFSKKIPKDRVERDFLEKDKGKKIEKFKKFLLDKGVYYPANGILFLSTETKISDLKKIIKCVNLGLAKYFL